LEHRHKLFIEPFLLQLFQKLLQLFLPETVSPNSPSQKNFSPSHIYFSPSQNLFLHQAKFGWQEKRGGDRTPATHSTLKHKELSSGDRSVRGFGKFDGKLTQITLNNILIPSVSVLFRIFAPN